MVQALAAGRSEEDILRGVEEYLEIGASRQRIGPTDGIRSRVSTYH